ncbi:MAG TPA: hypothetical protein VN043_04600 [Rhodanobacter sp.]|nr:hypothetical protein [Rhodanobacter sp.]
MRVPPSRRKRVIARRPHAGALLVAALLHGLFVLVAWYGMRPGTALPAHVAVSNEIMQIRFIDAAPRAAAAPPPPSLPPLPSRKPPPRAPRPIEPPSPGALVVTPPPTRLFDEHGQPLLPAPSSSTAPAPGYVQRLPQGDRRIMRHDSPIKYQSTRFEQDWDSGGNAVDGALQKLVDKTTVKKTIRLPGGIRIHCAISIAMLAGGCGGDPPPPPSKKDGDERLNMAPAASLDGHPHAPKPPSVEACIAMYRAGKPLAWGCPVDTPNRSVDAERREHLPAAAKQH